MAASIVFGQLKPTGSIGGPRSVQTAPRGLVAEPAGRPLGVLSQGTQVERSDSFPMIPLHSNPTPEGISNQKVSTYIECLGSLRDITEDDKEILSLLVNSRPQELSSCLEMFYNRCADMIIQDIKGYDGKRMTVYSNLGNNFYAFVIAGKTALEILGVEADESSLMDNAAKVALVRQGEAGKLLDGYLMDKEIDLLGRYYSAIQTGDPLKIDSGKKEIIRHVVDLEAKFLRCPFGSQDKIHFYQRYKLFYWQANVLLGGRELNEAVFLDNLPGLDEKTAFAMYEGLDRTQNLKNQNIFNTGDHLSAKTVPLREMGEIWDRCVAVPLTDMAQKNDLYAIWHFYAHLCKDIGASTDEIMATKRQKEESVSGNAATLAELSRSVNDGETLALSPSSLPQELRVLLEAIPFRDNRFANYWEALCSYCEVIYCVKNLEVSNMIHATVGGALGRAYPLAGVMEIDAEELNCDGGVYSLASIIVHELEHIIFETDNFASSDLGRYSVPSERNSFLFQSKADNVLLRIMIERDKEKGDKSKDVSGEIFYFALMSYSAELAARSANIVMGYGPDQMEYCTDMPAPLPCGELPDLDTYATNLDANLEMINDLIKGLNLTAQEEANVRNWYSKILNREAFFIIEMIPLPDSGWKPGKIELIDVKGNICEFRQGTKAAVLMPIQKLFGLPVNGILDEATARSLAVIYLTEGNSLAGTTQSRDFYKWLEKRTEGVDQKLWQETMRILGGQLSPMQTDRGFAIAVDIVSLGRDYYVKRLEKDNIEAEGLAYDILEKLTSLGFSRYECIIILNGIASQCALFQKENLETVLSQLEVNKRLENAYFSKD